MFNSLLFVSPPDIETRVCVFFRVLQRIKSPFLFLEIVIYIYILMEQGILLIVLRASDCSRSYQVDLITLGTSTNRRDLTH